MSQSPPSPWKLYLLSFLSTGIISCFGILSGVFAARILQPIGRGELAQIVFVPSLLLRVGSVGLQQGIAQSLIKLGPGDARDTERSLFSCGVVIAIVLGVCEAVLCRSTIRLLLPNISNETIELIEVNLFLLPLSFIMEVIQGLNIGRGDFRRFNAFQSLPVLLYCVFIVFFYFLGFAGPPMFVWANVLAWCLCILLRATEFVHCFSIKRLGRKTTKLILSNGFALFRADIATGMVGRIEQFFAARFLPADQLGLYAAASSIATGQAVAAAPVGRVLFYRASHPAGIDRPKSFAVPINDFRRAQVPFLVISLCAVAACGPITVTAFGESFGGAVLPSQVLCLSVLLLSLSSLLDSILKANAQIAAIERASICGCLIILSGALFLSAQITAFSLSLVALLAQLTGLVVRVGIFVRRLGLPAAELNGFTLSAGSQLITAIRSNLGSTFRRL
jgi:O-antigen/teichoic acid export membrane protein